MRLYSLCFFSFFIVFGFFDIVILPELQSHRGESFLILDSRECRGSREREDYELDYQTKQKVLLSAKSSVCGTVPGVCVCYRAQLATPRPLFCSKLARERERERVHALLFDNSPPPSNFHSLLSYHVLTTLDAHSPLSPLCLLFFFFFFLHLCRHYIIIFSSLPSPPSAGVVSREEVVVK